MKRFFTVLFCFLVFSVAASASADLRDTILSYLGDPDFSGDNFLQKLTGSKAKLELISYRDNHIYFSIDRYDYVKGVTFKRLTDKVKDVEVGKTFSGSIVVSSSSNEYLSLGTKAYYGKDRFFFRMPIDNFKFDKTKKIRYQFGRYAYDISLEELSDYIHNKVVYGGYLNVLERISGNMRMTFANHGVFVAKKEPSLQRLVASITRGSCSNEEKIQRLLDFVTQEIEYNWEETYASAETLKRPNEILMTGKSDCSGKTILFASLLNQINAEYFILYSGDGDSINHISIAVSGQFSKSNGLRFQLKNDKSYFIAETTAKGFRIGKTFLKDNPLSDSNEIYFQFPGEDAEVYNGKTGKSLSFM